MCSPIIIHAFLQVWGICFLFLCFHPNFRRNVYFIFNFWLWYDRIHRIWGSAGSCSPIHCCYRKLFACSLLLGVQACSLRVPIMQLARAWMLYIESKPNSQLAVSTERSESRFFAISRVSERVAFHHLYKFVFSVSFTALRFSWLIFRAHRERCILWESRTFLTGWLSASKNAPSDMTRITNGIHSRQCVSAYSLPVALSAKNSNFLFVSYVAIVKSCAVFRYAFKLHPLRLNCKSTTRWTATRWRNCILSQPSDLHHVQHV